MRRPYRFQFSLRFLLLLMLLSAVAVYLWGRPKHGTVSGTITVNGEPVGVATVIFRSSNGTARKADTDSDGKFQVRLLTGTCTIGVESAALTTKRYSSPKFSGIEIVVPEDVSDLRVELAQ